MDSSSRSTRQFLLLLSVAYICTSNGFVHRHGLTEPRLRGALSAVHVNPQKSDQRTLIPSDEREASAAQLDELLKKTPRDLNVLQQIAGHIEILCEDDISEEQQPNDEHQDSQPTNSNESTESTADEEEAARERRKLSARAALLGSRAPKGKPSSASARANSRTSTSVGKKRVGSASIARQGPGVTKRIMDAVRKSASSNKPNAENDNSQDRPSSSSKPISRKITPYGIHSAVLDLVDRQRKGESSSGDSAADRSSLNWNQPPQLLQPPSEHPFSCTPPAGTILIPPTFANGRESKLRFPDCLTVRVANGVSAQDTEVANLRLSVFSDFSPEVRRQLVSRSVNAVVTRRMKGATCLVATVPPSIAARKRNRPPVILGSAECSFHEFEGTTLGRRRPAQSILYITEVAVSPNARRRGIGRRLLEAIDVLANMRGIETLYLHVDVENQSALALYEQTGYQRVDKSDPMFLEFTTKLNLHDGATKGRNHFLLYKDMVRCPTWLADPLGDEQEHVQVVTPNFHRPAHGTLGFEVPC